MKKFTISDILINLCRKSGSNQIFMLGNRYSKWVVHWSTENFELVLKPVRVPTATIYSPEQITCQTWLPW